PNQFNLMHSNSQEKKTETTSSHTAFNKLSREQIFKLLKYILNLEYGYQLSFEKVIEENGFGQRVDLSDLEKRVFGLIIQKSKYNIDNSEFTEIKDSSEKELMNIIFSDIINQIKILKSRKIQVKHFFVFLNEFNNEEEEYARKLSQGIEEFFFEVLTIRDIIEKGIKHGIDFNSYLKNEGKSKIQRKNYEKISFHLDKVVVEDRLGREPVARAFTDLIKNDIFSEDLSHSFMVHLNGEWGAGKSSFLKLIKKNLKAGDKKWVIIEYNAWQNQHI